MQEDPEDQEFTAKVDAKMGRYVMEGKDYLSAVTREEFRFFCCSISSISAKGCSGLVLGHNLHWQQCLSISFEYGGVQ